MEAVRFDDIETLEKSVSDEFGEWSEPISVTQEMIDQFAELTGDRQWIHVDVERAKKESPFGGPIAHGFLTLSLVPGFKVDRIRLSGHKNAVNYGAKGLRFLSPVPAGSDVHARERVMEVDQRKSGTLITTEMEVRVVGAERPALLYQMQVLYQG